MCVERAKGCGAKQCRFISTVAHAAHTMTSPPVSLLVKSIPKHALVQGRPAAVVCIAAANTLASAERGFGLSAAHPHAHCVVLCCVLLTCALDTTLALARQTRYTLRQCLKPIPPTAKPSQPTAGHRREGSPPHAPAFLLALACSCAAASCCCGAMVSCCVQHGGGGKSGTSPRASSLRARRDQQPTSHTLLLPASTHTSF